MRYEAKTSWAGSALEARGLLEKAGYHLVETIHQVDTFFFSRSGNLKLRESAGGNALMQYQRDAAGVCITQYTPLDDYQVETVKAALTLANGVLGQVDKVRAVFRKDSGDLKVEAHLDDVKNLGIFVEVECWGPGSEEARDEFKSLLQIGDDEVHETYIKKLADLKQK